MAEKFLKYVESLEQSDPIFQVLPKYTNKKKLKELSKDLHERQKEVEKLADVKQVKTLLSILKEKVDRSKTTTDRFQNEYNNVLSLKGETDKLREDMLKEDSDLKNLAKLEQDMMAKRQVIIDQINQRQNEVNAEFGKFVDELQAKLK
jgi:hypothetical protein